MESIARAVSSGWVAPLGPEVEAFEKEFAQYVGVGHAAALSSGTAVLHLGLLLTGVRPGDDVLVSDLTFAASVNPIIYVGANPVLIDSERTSWNMDPDLLEAAIESRVRSGRRIGAVIPVHLYGQPANMSRISSICASHGIPMVEDAAEALGARCDTKAPGSFGQVGAFSFNGNKIITTSGGGMLVSNDAALVERARWLASQARDPAPHYEHSVIGYNYRLSNLLAALGRSQLSQLDERVAARRANYAAYRDALGNLPGIEFMPEAPWGMHSRWLTTLLIKPLEFGVDRESVRVELERNNIETRPLWKPMHLQPVFRDCERVGGEVAESLFEDGLCLPSGSSLSQKDRERVIHLFKDMHRSA
jgi:pyridoxal phosphate-dependent aminotransferase EpsN